MPRPPNRRKRTSRRLLVNLGCGPKRKGNIPPFFDEWEQLRVDVDEAVSPDVISDITDLSAVAGESADAIWISHCLEHLFLHDVPQALNEIHRVLRGDAFAVIIVPDLQTVAAYVASDQIYEPLYDSPAGPITPHDVIFGFGDALAAGSLAMAHRCGFTPSALVKCLQQAQFVEIAIRRRSNFELAAVVKPSSAGSLSAAELLNSLGL